jgi:hypothetical protein
MSNLSIKRLQIGNSTAGNNFVIRQPDAADGTLRISNGNIGATTDLISINSAGAVTFNGPVALNGGKAIYRTFTASGNYTSGTWYEIASTANLVEGTWIINAYVDTYAAGGSIYFCTYSTVPFYFYPVGSNSVATATLPEMYGTGHALNAPPPIIRLRLTLGGAGIFVDFNPNANWTGMDGTGGKTAIFRFRRIA